VHGAHYLSQRDDDVFTNSADFLSREMAQLSALRYIWAGVQHQLDTLRIVYASHSQLVQVLACSPMRFSPVFQMEDFFDRYPGAGIDGAHITFTDVSVDDSRETFTNIHDSPMGLVNLHLNYPQFEMNTSYQPAVLSQSADQRSSYPTHRKLHKRRKTTTGVSYPYPSPSTEDQFNPFDRQSSEKAHTTLAPQQPSQAPQLPPQSEHSEPSANQSTENNHLLNPTLTQSALSPAFMFSPMAHNVASQHLNNHDPFYGAQSGSPSLDHQTPSGMSASAGSASAPTETEGDPFLSFLEQLVENDGSGVANDLEFFLNDSRDSVLEDGVP
jgi:hypothetical protein